MSSHLCPCVCCYFICFFFSFSFISFVVVKFELVCSVIMLFWSDRFQYNDIYNILYGIASRFISLKKKFGFGFASIFLARTQLFAQ